MNTWSTGATARENNKVGIKYCMIKLVHTVWYMYTERETGRTGVPQGH